MRLIKNIVVLTCHGAYRKWRKSKLTQNNAL